jgi:hypothetical protein
MDPRVSLDTVEKRVSDFLCPDSVVYSVAYSLYLPDILVPMLKIAVAILFT